MDQADAVKKWKKDKPVLLTDTGVSDVLRKLPASWEKPVDISEVEQVMKDLKSMMTNKKIVESKSATSCLTTILAEVKKDLDYVTKSRARSIELMKEIHKDGLAYHAMCASGKLSKSKLASFQADLSKPVRELSTLNGGGQNAGAIPTRTYKEFEAAYQGLLDNAKAIVRIVEDAESKEPKWDTKKVFADSTKKFKDALDDMPDAWKQAEKLS